MYRLHPPAHHPSPPARAAQMLDAAKGMLYLHSHKPAIIHRDLKSPNLLVDKHWRVKVRPRSPRQGGEVRAAGRGEVGAAGRGDVSRSRSGACLSFCQHG